MKRKTERQAFEEWIRNLGVPNCLSTNEKGQYIYYNTAIRWLAWKASARRRRK